jgi:putative ABC transport system permease protein
MAAVALLLATVGVYVVTAYSVTQRTHEIGIRMALGARHRQVLLFVMRHGMRLSALGVAIGLFIALALGRVLAFFLRGVTLGQLSTYLGVSLLLLVVTLLANFIPARRATKVDPMAALRYE